MRWAVYRNYEGDQQNLAPSILGLAFDKESKNHLLNANNATSETTSNLNEAMESYGLSPYDTGESQKIRNLFNQGEVGKAYIKLIKVMDNAPEFDPKIADIAREMISYFQHHAQHEKIMLHDLVQRTVPYIKDGISDILDQLYEAERAIAETEVDIENVSGKMEQVNGETSEAQITAILGAAKGLMLWAEEQERLFEKLKPKRIDWYEEQAELEKKKNKLEFNTPRAA